MANATTSILTAEPTPAVARRSWPRWLALGLAAIAVALVALLWDAAGARLLLGSIGLFLAVRGALLVTSSGRVAAELAGRARALGAVALAGGAGAIAAAVAVGDLAGWVLLAGLPSLLLGAGLAVVARGGEARRGGRALLLWAVAATAVLAAVGLAVSWDRAVGVATALSALGVAVLGVAALVGAANLRALGALPDPEPEPARPVGCGGCACGAGGCGA